MRKGAAEVKDGAAPCDRGSVSTASVRLLAAWTPRSGVRSVRGSGARLASPRRSVRARR
jgi:hypothetical protein